MILNITERVEYLIAEIKEIVLYDFNEKNPIRFSIIYTRKKTFAIVPVPSNKPSFQLYVNGRFYKSYFFKNNEWTEL
jgi:hypothetical protein